MMKICELRLVLFLILLGLVSACSDDNGDNGPGSAGKESVTFELDKESVIKNPGMGWTIYDDANGEVADAATYWSKQDAIAREYASCFYIRWRWSDMEPEEGKYAWEYDDNFKALVQGALDRGLRLAFRVYVNGQDNIQPGTPQFVFDAGAKGYEVDKARTDGEKHLTPYADDPVFQEKFTNFVNAFAQKFDDAQIVNYIDGYNLGWWGEGHHVKYLNPANNVKTYEWLINLYGNAFKSVPLVMTLDSEIGLENERTYAYEGQGYVVRRDGVASQWFPESQKNLMRSFFEEKTMIVTEACYWGSGSISYANNIDNQYNWSSWADYYTQVVSEALSVNSNFLDLRTPVESARYVDVALEEVKKFAIHGGYRLYPEEITYNKENSSSLSITHKWKNNGVGYLPNNNLRWNYKYKVAIALLTEDNQLAKYWLSDNAEPSDWIKWKDYSFEENFSLSEVDAGNYLLAVAIVDTTNDDVPAINLAVMEKEQLTDNGWLKVAPVTIK